MPNRIRSETIRIRNETLAELKRIYATEWEEISEEVENLIDEIRLDDEQSTQAERLRHAEKGGNKDKLVALIVAAAVLANTRAINRINNSVKKIYTINAKDVISYILERTGVNLTFKSLTIQSLLGKHTKRRYDNATDSEYVSGQVMREIIDMLKKGEGTRKIAKRLEKVYGFNRTSAFRTVLTETTRAQGKGRLVALQEAEMQGFKFKKIWRHAHYVENPRDWHQHLHGTETDVDKPFLTEKGNYMMYPGDPTAPAEENINCHCFVDERLL